MPRQFWIPGEKGSGQVQRGFQRGGAAGAMLHGDYADPFAEVGDVEDWTDQVLLRSYWIRVPLRLLSHGAHLRISAAKDQGLESGSVEWAENCGAKECSGKVRVFLRGSAVCTPLCRLCTQYKRCGDQDSYGSETGGTFLRCGLSICA